MRQMGVQMPRSDAMKTEGRLRNSRRKWVSELINPVTRTWDEAVIRECCLPRDADAILSIKLPARACDVFVAWSAESNGIFSVRSAYRLGIQPTIDKLSQGQSSSEPTGDRGIWNIIWKAQVPQKLKIFAWRAATDSLAVRVGLHRRTIVSDPICAICGQDKEDVHHALINCTVAQALRDEMRSLWSLPPEEMFRKSGKEWLLTLLSCTSKETQSRIIFMLWRSWHHRNNILHGDGKALVSASVQFIANYHQSFVAANSSESSLDLYSWAAPVEGRLKANVDAGWDDISKKAGLGIVVRDHRGHPVLTEWRHIPLCASSEEAELMACIAGIKHLIDLRCWPATLETDCLHVATALLDRGKNHTGCWSLYNEARELLNVFQDIEIKKVDRVCNGVAHVLAQLGKSGFSGSLCDSAPACVQDLITNDVNIP